MAKWIEHASNIFVIKGNSGYAAWFLGLEIGLLYGAKMWHWDNDWDDWNACFTPSLRFLPRA